MLFLWQTKKARDKILIKGKTKIELTNIKTGVKQTITHDNMVTNAFADMCKPIGIYQPAITTYTQGNNSIATTVFGGIMLLDLVLNEDPDDYYIPGEATPVGYASDSAYSGEDTRKGGYNSVESGLQEDGSYKHVWDFTTSQANGTIASLGLVPREFGKIGIKYDSNHLNGNDFGLKIYTKDTSPIKILNMFDEKNFDYILFLNGDDLYGIKKYNLTYDYNHADEHYTKNGGYIKIVRYKVANMSVGIGYNQTLYNELFLEEIPIKIPEEIMIDNNGDITSNSQIYGGITVYNGMVSFYLRKSNYNIANGSEFKILFINLKNNFEISVRTFTNTTGETLILGRTSDGVGTKRTAIYHDYAILSSNTKIYVINLNDITDIVSITDNYNFYFVYRFGDYVLLYYDGNYCYMFNIKKCKYNSMSTTATFVGANRMYFNGEMGNKICRISFYSSTYYFFVNPFILMTKNNLPEPIIKTENQVMKITYTLSES